ncbi:ribosome recycling factor [Hydrogenophilus thiooxidans]|uniref:ribosome recycling factor n=1 Tax=Hydrogenophilus thiooxidans TaxID=2820326 RepID=UPI001C238D3E|nr:ribosome recycling factor [Hydrogenophilus thiooxidans]
MSVAELKQDAERRMKKAVETLKEELTKIRTGRAHTGLLDHVMVEYYGTMVPIPQVANVTLLDARTLGVQPWEKSMMSKVEKAIRESDLGLNPANMGEIIRVPMPPLTEERRRELTKVVRHEGEQVRVAVRNVRRDIIQALKELQKKKGITEDELRRAEEEVQKLTDRFVKVIDETIEKKEAELMQI